MSLRRDSVILTLQSFSPPLVVEALKYGFTIHRILINDGKTNDVVIGPENPEDHKAARRFINCVVGRYSNRIPKGEYDLEKNGYKGHLVVDNNESTEVQLHGGADGFDRREFTVIDPTLSSSSSSEYTLFSDEEKKTIRSLVEARVFKLVSPDGDQGYPGRLELEVLLGIVGTPCKVSDEENYLGSVFIVYRARLAEGEKCVTPINLTQHWGFNLDASLAGPSGPTPNVKDHKLTIKADNTIRLHPNGLATGELDSTAGTPHAHEDKLIGDNFPEKGYDHYYVFKERKTDPIHVPLNELESLSVVNKLIAAPSEDTPVTLSSEKSGVRLTFETNQPGVQFYSGNFMNGEGHRKKIHGGSGPDSVDDGYKAQAAAFLEFHEPLAAWLHDWGKGGKDTLLTPDELYNNYTKLNVYKRTEQAFE